MRALGLVLLVIVVAAGAGCGGKPEPEGLLVGAVEDAAKWSPDPGVTMRKTRDAGFRSVVLSAVWEPGRSPSALVPELRRAAAAADANDVAPVLAVYQFSRATPDTGPERAEFSRFAVSLVRELPEVRTVIVGNEPNLNLFWQPQFDAEGGDAAATSYFHLLAATYDALKHEDDDLTIVGGGLSPHGEDAPGSRRPTHSPTAFIRDLGRAYRASGRDRPIMDALSLHVYGESARVPPSLRHPRSTTIGIPDYRKVVALLRDAFDGTPQRGHDLPIVYGEYGVETFVPLHKRPAYSGSEVVSVVPEDVQAEYYRRAVALAACQPTVEALYLFHVIDETPFTGLQSGVFYADGTPKTSLRAVRDALREPRCGKVPG